LSVLEPPQASRLSSEPDVEPSRKEALEVACGRLAALRTAGRHVARECFEDRVIPALLGRSRRARQSTRQSIDILLRQMLRQFLYRDDDLIADFLSQVEGGTFDEEHQRSVRTGDRAVTGELGIGGTKIGGKRGSGDQAESERTVRLTPAALFGRLYDALDNVGEIQWLESLDDDIWRQLKRGEIVEVEAVIASSTISRLSSLAEQVGPLLQVMQAMGEDVDDSTREAMTGIQSVGDMFGSNVPVIARAAGAEKYKFITNLDRSRLLVSVDQIDGEATVCGKIQRILKPSEKYTLFESLPGMGALPREMRREMQRGVKNEKDLPDAVVSGPAAVITPIAIYR
jgi:hypothetical protein